MQMQVTAKTRRLVRAGTEIVSATEAAVGIGRGGTGVEVEIVAATGVATATGVANVTEVVTGVEIVVTGVIVAAIEDVTAVEVAAETATEAAVMVEIGVAAVTEVVAAIVIVAGAVTEIAGEAGTAAVIVIVTDEMKEDAKVDGTPTRHAVKMPNSRALCSSHLTARHHHCCPQLGPREWLQEMF